MDAICELPQAHGADSLFTVCSNGKLIDIITKDEDPGEAASWTGAEAVGR